MLLFGIYVKAQLLKQVHIIINYRRFVLVNCLAIDIGAGSGRIILGNLDGGRISLEEVYRFENGIEHIDGKDRWDIDKLFNDIVTGLKVVSDKKIDSIGIDTWGVDFVLLDENGEKLEVPVSYRDSRTEGMMDKYFALMDKETLYTKTGIQFLNFNTVFQFMAMVQDDREILDKAKTFLMIPDYLNYKLTGQIVNEFTNMSTTQMMNAEKRTWDNEILDTLGINRDMFSDSVMPGHRVGEYNGIPVHSVASHDTGSAIAATPAAGNDWAYISSGTWCLMGVESAHAITDKKAFEYNFTNEGGVNGTSRILKNIMGLWIIRGIRKSFNDTYSYPELIKMGMDSEAFKHIVYVNDDMFTNPDDMCRAIDDFCMKTGQDKPETPGEYIRCAEEGLAFLYKQVLLELRDIYEKPINKLHILGGGVNDQMMCQFAADATGLDTFAGPIEATAIGNILVQGIATKEISTLAEGREIVRNSFPVDTYRPENKELWEKNYKRYMEIKEIISCL